MNEVVEYLKTVKYVFVATVDNDKPRIRPFANPVEINGSLYFGTSNDKEVYKQLVSNQNVEIIAINDKMQQLRLSVTAKEDTTEELIKSYFEIYPEVGERYKGIEEKMSLFKISDALGVISSFSDEPKTIKF